MNYIRVGTVALMLVAQPNAERIDQEHFLPQRRGCLVRWSHGSRDAGKVSGLVDAPKHGYRLGGCGVHVNLFGDMARNRQRLRAICLDDVQYEIVITRLNATPDTGPSQFRLPLMRGTRVFRSCYSQ